MLKDNKEKFKTFLSDMKNQHCIDKETSYKITKILDETDNMEFEQLSSKFD